MPSRTITETERERLNSLSDRFRPIAERVIEIADERCRAEDCEILLVYGRRSLTEQLELWSRGRAMIDPKGSALDKQNWRILGDTRTDAMPGSSAHNFGEAIDLALVSSRTRAWLRDGDQRWYTIVGAAARSEGLKWPIMLSGARPDLAHIQHPLWREARDVYLEEQAAAQRGGKP